MIMAQKDFWEAAWEKKKIKHPNKFARECYAQIRDKNFETLLDLGCGDGRDAAYFARKGFKVTAVDFSESGIRHLKQRIKEGKLSNITPLLKDIKKIKFKEKFDVIYAHLSLQYFDDARTTQIFNELFKILKKDGLIFIKCKSIEDDRYGVGKKVGEDTYLKGDHLRHFFTKEYMKEKLEPFKILRLRKTSSVYHQYKSSFIEAIARKQS